MYVSAGPRIFILVLLILVLSLGGLVWFDYLGVVDAKNFLSPVFRLVGLSSRTKVEGLEDPLLLDRERMKMQLEYVTLRNQELDQFTADLDKKSQEIDQRLVDLEEKENAFLEQQKSFNEELDQYDNKKANLEKNAEYLVGMDPRKAVDILLAMDDQLVIDTMRTTERLSKEAGEEASMVSYWLSLMPADKAATIQRKMGIKPEG